MADERPLDKRIAGWLMVGVLALDIVVVLNHLSHDEIGDRLRTTIDNMRAGWRARHRDVDADAKATVVEIEQFLHRASRRA